MKLGSKTILLTVSLLSVASPAFAKDDKDEERSQTNTSQPSSERQDTTTTRPPRQEERREDTTTTRPPRQEERREDTTTPRPPRQEERREDTTTTRPPRPIGTGSSTTRPPAPSSTGTTVPRESQGGGRKDSNKPDSDKDLREVLVKITNSSLDATLKASLAQQVQTVINAIVHNDIFWERPTGILFPTTPGVDPCSSRTPAWGVNKIKPTISIYIHKLSIGAFVVE